MAAGRLVVAPWFPARDRQGRLVSGALFTVWTNQTTTKASIYADEALTTPLANPVAANSSGQFPAVWAEAGDVETPTLYSVGISGPAGESILNPAVLDNWQPSLDGTPTQAAIAEAAAASSQAYYEDILALEGIADPSIALATRAAKAANLSDLASASTARTNLGATTIGNAVFTAASAAAISETLLVRPEPTSQANGVDVLENVTTGVRNTGFGYNALKANTGGNENTAVGFLALTKVTGGVDPVANYNTAFGSYALAELTTGWKNTAVGRASSDFLTTGAENTAIGYGSFHAATTAVNCVAVGFEAVHGGVTGPVTGASLTGVGWRSLYSCLNGTSNTAMGAQSLRDLTSGSRNTAIGVGALAVTNGNDCVAVGYFAGLTTTGSGNILIGQGADATPGLSGVTVLASGGVVGTVANTLYLGNGQTVVPGGAARDLGSAANPWNYVIGQNSFYAQYGVAIPAGGSTGKGYLLSSTSNFGIFFGSGAPTLTAAKGSLYLRSDGSGTNNRIYVNTDNGSTWTALVTVA